MSIGGKIIVAIIGFGFGIFMIVNGIVVFPRYLNGYDRVLTTTEWLSSSMVTFAVGIILLVWTILLMRKSS